MNPEVGSRGRDARVDDIGAVVTGAATAGRRAPAPDVRILKVSDFISPAKGCSLLLSRWWRHAMPDANHTFFMSLSVHMLPSLFGLRAIHDIDSIWGRGFPLKPSSWVSYAAARTVWGEKLIPSSESFPYRLLHIQVSQIDAGRLDGELTSLLRVGSCVKTEKPS